MRVDQLVPAFHHGDAIGDTASHLKSFFISQGFESEIYCLERDKGLEKNSRLFEEFSPPDVKDVTILHFALVSPLSQSMISLDSKKVIIYHNITPEEFFSDYSQEMARIARLSRDQIKDLAPHADLALGDSEYNRRELESYGFTKSGVLPLFIDFDRYERPHNPFIHDLYKDGRVNILFVGRIVPNKRIEELIKVVFYYKKYVSPLVRLIVIGKTDSLPKYYQSLIRIADEFYLKPEEICFTGHIPDDEMYAIYKASDVFLSLSEHEGFGLPFIESMVFDLPIIAFDSTAVPFTLDGSGVLIKHKKVDQVGELVRVISGNEDLKNRVIESQRKSLSRFKAFGREKHLLKQIEELIK
jgi:glycosyltransferase involved in cell wall biosynthesis